VDDTRDGGLMAQAKRSWRPTVEADKVSAAAGSVGTIVGQGSRLSADAPVAGAAENVAPGSAAR
jgi:hypothetical protein